MVQLSTLTQNTSNRVVEHIVVQIVFTDDGVISNAELLSLGGEGLITHPTSNYIIFTTANNEETPAESIVNFRSSNTIVV